jgi:hypothetical protein
VKSFSHRTTGGNHSSFLVEKRKPNPALYEGERKGKTTEAPQQVRQHFCATFAGDLEQFYKDECEIRNGRKKRDEF